MLDSYKILISLISVKSPLQLSLILWIFIVIASPIWNGSLTNLQRIIKSFRHPLKNKIFKLLNLLAWFKSILPISLIFGKEIFLASSYFEQSKRKWTSFSTCPWSQNLQIYSYRLVLYHLAVREASLWQESWIFVKLVCFRILLNLGISFYRKGISPL